MRLCRSRRCVATQLFILAAFVTPLSQSQTLGEQYEIYLPKKCREMNFAREDHDILPGQAGPNLFAFCNGAYSEASGGPTITTTSIAGGTATSGRGASPDEALRQRRDEMRDEQSTDFSRVGLFVSFDRRDEEQDITSYEDGHEANRSILTLGIDRRFVANLLLGVAVRKEDIDGVFAGGGGTWSQGYGVSLYGSWSAGGFFIDLNGGYDTREIDTQRLTARRVVTTSPPVISIPPSPPPAPVITFDPPHTFVDGATNSDEDSVDVLIGYDLFIWRLNIGPRVGGSLRNTQVDAYVESGNTLMTLAFDERYTRSLVGTVGLLVNVPITVGSVVLVPQLDAAWAHEYRDDQQLLTAHFAEDLRANPTRLEFLTEAPDRDTSSMRLSLSAVMPHGLNIFVAAEKMFAHDYRRQTGASIGLRWEL